MSVTFFYHYISVDCPKTRANPGISTSSIVVKIVDFRVILKKKKNEKAFLLCKVLISAIFLPVF